MEASSARVALCTVPDRETALRLARSLVGARLAACVNVVPGLTSVYRWEGAVEESAEILLVIKTTTEALPSLSARIVAEHPYSVPEILALEPRHGHQPYLDWILASVGSRAEDAP